MVDHIIFLTITTPVLSDNFPANTTANFEEYSQQLSVPSKLLPAWFWLRKLLRERIQVLYGDDARVEMESRPGRGTKVALRMPVIEGGGEGWGKMREAVEGALRGLGR